MKQLRFKWKYLLASILLANIIACSNDDLAQMANRQEHDSGTRTAELVTKTIMLETEGTLEAKVTEAMGDAEVSTLEKLIVSGPFTSTDMQYLRDSLTGLTILNMEGVQIKASDVAYKYVSWGNSYFYDNEICEGMFYDMDNLKEIVLPVAVTDMRRYALYNCDSLQNVVLPMNLEVIEDQSFYYCGQLSSLTFPSSLRRIGEHAFSHCALKSIILSDSLSTINNYAFYGCNNLKEVVIPESITSLYISDHAFYYCNSLESVHILGGVESIGYKAFEECHSLKNIVLPANLKVIGQSAFAYCRSLKELTIPASVTYVGDSFLNGCTQLRALIWNSEIADVPQSWSLNCFLFVSTDQIAVLNPDNWEAIIINGDAESTINIDFGDAFANMKEFTAKKLKYSREFRSGTQPGGSAGWQTIVLPFTPDSIYHETKGQIAPFGSGIEGAKPFWLRELTSEGFVDVTKIEPNKPYIIAMPNHSDYLDEYRLSGNITFIARDSVLRVTPAELQPSVGPEFELHPTYRYLSSSSNIYYLTSEWNYYEEEQMYYDKNFFKKNEWGSVDKFNAYVTTLGGGRSSRTLFDLDTRSKETRAAWIPNKTGIPQIGDM